MKNINNFWLLGSTIAFVMFLLNVVGGKFVISYSFDQALIVDDIGEFIILFVAVIFFVIGIIAEENKENRVN